MLYDKVLPAFFLIEVEDAAVKALIDQQFSIKKVIIASSEFPDDIAATHAAKEVVKFFIRSSPVDMTSAVEEIKLNPEFYPSAVQLDSKERELAADLLAADIADHEMPPGKMLVPMTRNFDIAGDFVQTRSIVSGSNFKITTRIAIPPSVYLQHKVEDEPHVRLSEAHR